MNESKLFTLYKKAGGKELLHKLFREGMLPAALLSVASNGISRKGLEILRLTLESKTKKRLVKRHLKNINSIRFDAEQNYQASSVKQCSRVWSLWLQGVETAPDIVKRCMASHQNRLTESDVIVLTESNYRDYVEFPKPIQQKIDSGCISKTHMSDLLRLELLTQYGGTWIDSTVFLTGNLPLYMTRSDLFMFQTLKPGLDGHTLSISSWFITAQKPSKILEFAKAALYDYWSCHEYLIDYYLIHYCVQLGIELYPDEWEKVIPASNETPHIMLLNMDKPFDSLWFDGVLSQTNVHKLTYKNLPNKTHVCETNLEHLLKVG